MFRSIRVTLLFWYAVILLGAIALLGTTLHQELRSTLYREADAQLAQWLALLRRGVVPRDGAAPGQDIAATARTLLPDSALFAVFDPRGQLLAASTGGMPVAAPQRRETATRDDHRWSAEPLPGAAGWLVIGRSVRDENHGIRRFLVVLLGAGAGVVALALGGGYLLVSRALRPAREIARTAQRISAQNLGERIPLAHVPGELHAVATTLNDSFARLEAAFTAQAAFTADASHELRTPLAILLAHLELAATPSQTTADLRERLAICHDAAQRLESIVAVLLTLARADAGQLPLVAHPVELTALVEAEIEAMAPLARQRGIEIERDTVAVTVSGDGDRLREVVTNLIDNAIRYNRDGGRIRVTVTRAGDDAILRVADTGIGIAEEHRARVFERFFRADPARAGSRGGSGLGLAIVRWIVERHGGTIAVGGQLGQGAEFVVRLPLAERAR